MDLLTPSADGSIRYVLTGTRGSRTRIRLLVALNEQPRNASQLAAALGLDTGTVRHHLEVLTENGLVTDEKAGTSYRPSEMVRANWDTVDELAGRLRG